VSSVRDVAVLGAGAWGTALATVLAGKGRRVRLWCHEAEVADRVNRERRNPYLEGVEIPRGVRASAEITEAIEGARFVVSVSPAQFVRSVMEAASDALAPGTIVVSASKGIETDTRLRMDQVLSTVLPRPVMDGFTVLSGPSFAHEVAAGMPTAVVVAARSREVARAVQELFQTSSFRVYTNRDVIGVELGGAVKNVIALGAGVSAGLGFGHNTLAALVTRGLAEITRLGVALGAERQTFYGLAGVGDLMLTCTSADSRNRTVGYRLGQGESLASILSSSRAVAEGVWTSEAVVGLARELGVEMPISEEVYAIVHQHRDPAEALAALMSREPKAEDWSS